jgi:predicted TIM-barrel fold metal-dependent hydrolase
VREQYDAVLDISSNAARSLDDLRQEMAEIGVERAVVHAEYEFGDPVDALNEALAKLVAEEPERFSGVGTFSMEHFEIARALDQVAVCKEAGFVGISTQPSFFHMSIDDKRLYPVYAKAMELGLLVCLHTGVNYGVTHPIRNDHPLMVDDVACDFPTLKLVACHAGWPWATEMVAVARKHPNVYMEFGGLAPKYVGAAGSGWEVMYRFMNSLLADQVLFGTDWPVISQTRALAEWRSLGLKPVVLEKLLGGNAANLLQGI